MADWFKFYNDCLDSKGMQYALSEQPLVPSVWLVILSEASKNRSNKFRWTDDDYELIGFARKINVSVPVFNQSLSLLEKVKYILRKEGFIEIPAWDSMQSDYAKGLNRGYYKKTSEKLASNSEVSTVRGEESRGEEKRIEKGESPNGFHKNGRASPTAIMIGNEKALERVENRIRSIREISPLPKGDSRIQELQELKQEKTRLLKELGLKA